MTIYPGPDLGNATFLASIDDEYGITVSVYRDHDGIRVDAGGTQIMLSGDGCHALIAELKNALIEATLWGLSHE